MVDPMALSAQQNNKYGMFGPLLSGFKQVEFNNINKLKVINQKTAGIIEPIQGEGGIRPADLSFKVFKKNL